MAYQKVSEQYFNSISHTLEWLANVFDPEEKDAKRYLIAMPNETQEQAWQSHLRYLDDKVLGPPMSTTECKSTELAHEKLVGVYRIKR